MIEHACDLQGDKIAFLRKTRKFRGKRLMFTGLDKGSAEQREATERFLRIKDELLSGPVHLCPERALLITEYFKRYDIKKDPMVVRKAKALRYLLQRKSIRIWPDELIVGNVGTK